jgi:hypothetical protein
LEGKKFYSCIHGKNGKKIPIHVEKCYDWLQKKNFLLKMPIKLIDQAG